MFTQSTTYDEAVVLGKAFPVAFTPSNITRGFQLSSPYLLNEDIFQYFGFSRSIVRGPLMCTSTREDQPAN